MSHDLFIYLQEAIKIIKIKKKLKKKMKNYMVTHTFKSKEANAKPLFNDWFEFN